ncbi:hypothetical protein ABPG72_011601 [Tetrahymena utriculariae]
MIIFRILQKNWWAQLNFISNQFIHSGFSLQASMQLPKSYQFQIKIQPKLEPQGENMKLIAIRDMLTMAKISRIQVDDFIFSIQSKQALIIQCYYWLKHTVSWLYQSQLYSFYTQLLYQQVFDILLRIKPPLQSIHSSLFLPVHVKHVSCHSSHLLQLKKISFFTQDTLTKSWQQNIIICSSYAILVRRALKFKTWLITRLARTSLIILNSFKIIQKNTIMNIDQPNLSIQTSKITQPKLKIFKFLLIFVKKFKILV